MNRNKILKHLIEVEHTCISTMEQSFYYFSVQSPHRLVLRVSFSTFINIRDRERQNIRKNKY